MVRGRFFIVVSEGDGFDDVGGGTEVLDNADLTQSLKSPLVRLVTRAIEGVVEVGLTVDVGAVVGEDQRVGHGCVVFHIDTVPSGVGLRHRPL